jgi:hypothetical protein
VKNRIEIKRIIILFLAAALTCGAGSEILQAAPKEGPVSALEAFISPKKEDPKQNQTIRAVLLEFADQYASALADALDPLLARSREPEVRLAAQDAKAIPAYLTMVTANAPNPRVALINMIGLVIAEQQYAKQVSAPRLDDKGGRELLETHRILVKRAWVIADSLLESQLQQQLRKEIEKWKASKKEDNPGGAKRSLDLLAIAGLSPSARQGGGGLFGISDAARSVDEARILGERSLYFLERLPLFMSWQLELLLYKLAATPEARETLANLSRMLPVLDKFTNTLDNLPALISREREAAISDIASLIARERGALFSGIEEQEAGLKELLTDTRATLAEAAPLVEGVQDIVGKGRALLNDTEGTVKLVSESIAGVNELTVRAEALTRILEKSALDVPSLRAAITELNAIVQGLNRALASTKRMVTGPGLDPFDRILRVGVILILLFFLCALGSALLYRIIAARIRIAGP